MKFEKIYVEVGNPGDIDYVASVEASVIEVQDEGPLERKLVLFETEKGKFTGVSVNNKVTSSVLTKKPKNFILRMLGF